MANKGVEKRAKGPLAVVFFCALTVGMVVVHIYLRGVYPPGHQVRLVVTGLMVIGFASLVFVYTRLLRTMDEYQRQIQLFALAIGFPLSLVTALGIGYFRAEGLLAGRDPRDLPLVLLIPYGVGFLISWIRYK